MNFEKILSESVSDSTMTENYTIKMHSEQKSMFLAVCKKHKLSPGKVMRALIDEFIEAAKQ